MNHRHLDAALHDAVEATDWIETHLGKGDAFNAAYRRAVAAIAANPRMYPRTEDGPDEPENREFYIARFEYRVIYAFWQDELVIVAVLHASRRPGLWTPRLDDITLPEDRP
jgi:plasmid stabilization system protein ParE